MNRIRRSMSAVCLCLYFISGYAQVEKNLAAFAKSYGYTKYFYPGESQTLINWNRFAVFGAEQCLVSKKRGVELLREIFAGLGKDVSFSKGMASSGKEPPKLRDTTQFPMIYWQHLGNGEGAVGYPYKSMRVNRPSRLLPESPNDFYSFRRVLDTAKTAGKTITATVRFRADGYYIGRPSLLLMYRKPGEDFQTVSSEGQSISIGQWSTHHITTTLPAKIDRAYLYVQNVGMAGTIHVDDLQLNISSKEKSEYSVFADFTGESVSSFQSLYRPSGPNQEFRIVREADNVYIALSRTGGNRVQLPALFKETPAQSFYRTTVGNEIVLSFPLTKKITDTLIDAEALKFSEYLNVLRTDDASVLKVTTRLANVIIAWNVIKHFHPMLQREINWDKALKKALHKSFSDRTAEEHKNTMTQMMQDLKDSHMTFYYSKTTQEDFYPPVSWEYIENNLIVTHSVDSLLSRGDKIVSVNGVAAKDFWHNALSNVLGANESRKKYKASIESLKGPQSTPISIKFIHGDQVRITRVFRNLNESDFFRLTGKNAKPAYAEMSPGIYYYDVSRINWTDLQKHTEEMKNAQGIVIDLRGYPQWETINILKHFTSVPLVRMEYQIPQIVYPDHQAWTYKSLKKDSLLPAAPFVNCKKVFLISGSSLSYCEDFIEMVKYYKLGTLVGEQTAGVTGNTNNIYLLGGLYTPWSGMRVFTQNGNPFNGHGILPDYRIERSRSGVVHEKDEQLTFALKLLENN